MKNYVVVIDFEPFALHVEADTWEDAMVKAHEEMSEENYQPLDWWIGYAEDYDGNEVYSA